MWFLKREYESQRYQKIEEKNTAETAGRAALRRYGFYFYSYDWSWIVASFYTFPYLCEGFRVGQPKETEKALYNDDRYSNKLYLIVFVTSFFLLTDHVKRIR